MATMCLTACRTRLDASRARRLMASMGELKRGWCYGGQAVLSGGLCLLWLGGRCGSASAHSPVRAERRRSLTKPRHSTALHGYQAEELTTARLLQHLTRQTPPHDFRLHSTPIHLVHPLLPSATQQLVARVCYAYLLEGATAQALSQGCVLAGPRCFDPPAVWLSTSPGPCVDMSSSIHYVLPLMQPMSFLRSFCSAPSPPFSPPHLLPRRPAMRTPPPPPPRPTRRSTSTT